jgi:hypothetical protein
LPTFIGGIFLAYKIRITPNIFHVKSSHTANNSHNKTSSQIEQVKHKSHLNILDRLAPKAAESPLGMTRGADRLWRSLRFQSDLAIILGVVFGCSSGVGEGTGALLSGDGSGAFAFGGSGASACGGTPDATAIGTGVTGVTGITGVAGVAGVTGITCVTGVTGVGINVAGVCADAVRTLGDSSVIGTDEGGAVEVGAGTSVGAVFRTMAPLSCVLLGGDSGGVGDLLFLLFGNVLSSLATDAESAKYPMV